MATFPRPPVTLGTRTARPILREVVLDEFFGFCDVLRNSQAPLLTVAWREALAEFPDYKPMLEVLRAAISIFKTATMAHTGITQRLYQSSSESGSATDPATTYRLGAQGRKLGHLFLNCKHQPGTRFSNAAEIKEVIRRLGWDASFIAANLAAYCEAAENPEFWPRGDEQGQLWRHKVFDEWEDNAGEWAEKVKVQMDKLGTLVMMFAEKYGVADP